MLPFPFLDILQSLAYPCFTSLYRWVIVFPSLQGFRHTFHVCQLFLRIMSILIAFSIMQVLHEGCRCISYLQGDRFTQHMHSILLRCAVCHIQGIGFRRKRKIGNRMCQMYITLRHTEKMACLINRNADFQGTAVRHPDILTRKTNQTPCHVQRVLPASSILASQ